MSLEAIVCHFVAIGEIELELPSGNVQIGAKLSVFHPV